MRGQAATPFQQIGNDRAGFLLHALERLFRNRLGLSGRPALEAAATAFRQVTELQRHHRVDAAIHQRSGDQPAHAAQQAADHVAGNVGHVFQRPRHDNDGRHIPQDAQAAAQVRPAEIDSRHPRNEIGIPPEHDEGIDRPVHRHSRRDAHPDGFGMDQRIHFRIQRLQQGFDMVAFEGFKFHRYSHGLVLRRLRRALQQRTPLGDARTNGVAFVFQQRIGRQHVEVFQVVFQPRGQRRRFRRLRIYHDRGRPGRDRHGQE